MLGAMAALWIPLWLLLPGPFAEAAAEPGARSIDVAVTVNAELAVVWRAWTTQAGVETFFAPKARIGGAPGEAYELYFYPENPRGRRGAEGSVIVAMQPERMLTFTWGQSPEFTTLRGQHTTVVVRFAAVGARATRVKLTNVGFGVGGEWDSSYEFFRRGWAQVLCNLKTRFERGPVDWVTVSPYATPFDCGNAIEGMSGIDSAMPGGSLEDLAWLIGGTWTAETNDAGGQPVFVDVTYRWANHRRAIAYQIATRSATGVNATHEGMAWWDPATSRLKLVEVDQNGHHVTGSFAIGRERIDIEETMTTVSGATHRQRAELLRKGNDAFTFVAWFLKDDAWVHAITFEYRRNPAATR